MRIIGAFRQTQKKKAVICGKLHPTSGTRSCYQYHHHGGRLVASSTKTIRNTTDQEKTDVSLDRRRAGDTDDNLKEKQGRKGRKRSQGGARPLFFQRTPKFDPSSLSLSSSWQDSTTTTLSTITPYDLKGTTANLPPSYWHSSPCLGAALSNSPFVGNLMKYYQLTNAAAGVEDTSCDDDDPEWTCFHLDQASRLSHLLFFRLIPESPIHLVRNKSMPGSLLTPGIIGSYLSNYWTGSTGDTCSKSHNSHHDDRNTRTKKENRNKKKKNLYTKDDTSRRMLQDLLRSRFGIRSNRIGNNGEWTGISMARWMELHVPRIPGPSSCIVVNDIQDSESKTTAAATPQSSQLLADVLVPALWLVALWGVAGTRWDFQEYRNSLLNQEDYTSTQPFSAFQASDLSKTNISDAMDRLWTFYSTPRNFDSLDSHEDDSGEKKSVAEAFEMVCVAIALTNAPDESSPMPQPIPNGYYMYGSDAEVFVPDCVEVAIREILQFLLFPDDSTKNGRNDAAIDISKLPSTASDNLRELLMQQQYQHGPEYKDHPLKQQQSALGQLWFDLLSDLPHCEYFVTTPSGTKYELTPTVENICTALWCLLVDGHNNDEDTNNIRNMRPSKSGSTWKTLEDLSRFWNSLHPIDETSNKLFVRQDTLKHVRPSTGDIMEHEVVYLQLERNPNALEIRLRCDWTDESGMAAVTHLREGPSNDESLFEADKVDLLLDLLKSKYISSTDSCALQQRDSSLAMLCLALLPFRTEDYAEYEDLSLFSLACLSTAYGIDRRELLLKKKHYDDKSVVDRETSYEEALIDSREILKERILQCCDFATYNPLAGKRLLTWILQESPTVTESSSSSISGSRKMMVDANIEGCISKLPVEAMDEQLFDAIQFNWACRGRALSALLQLRSGNMTPTELFFSIFYGKLGLGDLVDLIDLYRHSRDD